VRISEKVVVSSLKEYIMETTAVDPGVSHDPAIDAGMIIAALHQPEKIETVVVAGDFIELGSSYETAEQTVVSTGGDESQVYGVVDMEHDNGAATSSGMEVIEVPPINRKIIDIIALLLCKMLIAGVAFLTKLLSCVSYMSYLERQCR